MDYCSQGQVCDNLFNVVGLYEIRPHFHQFSTTDGRKQSTLYTPGNGRQKK